MRFAPFGPTRPQMPSGHRRMTTIASSTHSTMHNCYYHTMWMYSGTVSNSVGAAFGNCLANGSAGTHTIYSRITTSIFVDAPKNWRTWNRWRMWMDSLNDSMMFRLNDDVSARYVGNAVGWDCESGKFKSLLLLRSSALDAPVSALNGLVLSRAVIRSYERRFGTVPFSCGRYSAGSCEESWFFALWHLSVAAAAACRLYELIFHF